MTVRRRPVASWKPQSVGDSGLDRVGTRKTGVKVPPPTPSLTTRAVWQEAELARRDKTDEHRLAGGGACAEQRHAAKHA
jgi:hypothetical protein